MSDGEWFSKLAAQGEKVPNSFAARPGLHHHERPFWDAFQFLHPSRPNTGFGPGAIPLGELIVYAELMQMPVGGEREQFVSILREMDVAYLTWVREHHG